jgi:alpha-L-rhamnosidase
MGGPFGSVQARWIWPQGAGNGPNLFVEYRHDFEGAEGVNALLRISADSDYVAFLNGGIVGSGQFSDYPDDRSYDEHDVSSLLRPGSNALTVLVWYKGEDSSQYRKGDPGLIYLLTAGGLTVASGTDTRWRPSRGYKSGPIERISNQLGFSFSYDASGAQTGEWLPLRAADATELRRRGEPKPRPLPRLAVGERIPARICAQGVFRRPDGTGKTVAELMQTDLLSPRPLCELTEPGVPGGPHLRSSEGGVDGLYLVLDLGREEAGYLEIEVEAEAGQLIDVAWGEHLHDLRVRAAVGGRNFAGRYTCAAGRHTFTHRFTRIAGRYIELHVSDARAGIVLHYAGLRPTEYPVVERGAFWAPDSLWNRIHATSLRTLQLCMHEHYEDCPWREQSLYANDSLNQALSGYYGFGEYAFPAVSFDLLGRGLCEDGYLELCAPARVPITIPGFSMCWIIELGDHLLYSGDLDSARAQYPRVRAMLASYGKSMREGLLPCPVGARYWHFYDWAPGLSGTDRGGASWFEVLSSERFDAPLSLLYCLALRSAARIARALGHDEEATRHDSLAGSVASAVRRRFWSEEKRLLLTYDERQAPNFAELTQSLALLAGACSGEESSHLRRRLCAADNGLVETTLSQSLYKLEALLMEPEAHGRWVFDKISADWGHMLDCGATSFWETLDGAEDFDRAGSLCHGWSAIPVYFLQAYLLGIKPLENGFARAAFRPVRGVVDRARGIIPTSRGPIRVSWEDVHGELCARIESPEGVAVER